MSMRDRQPAMLILELVDDQNVQAPRCSTIMCA